MGSLHSPRKFVRLRFLSSLPRGVCVCVPDCCRQTDRFSTRRIFNANHKNNNDVVSTILGTQHHRNNNDTKPPSPHVVSPPPSRARAALENTPERLCFSSLSTNNNHNQRTRMRHFQPLHTTIQDYTFCLPLLTNETPITAHNIFLVLQTKKSPGNPWRGDAEAPATRPAIAPPGAPPLFELIPNLATVPSQLLAPVSAWRDAATALLLGFSVGRICAHEHTKKETRRCTGGGAGFGMGAQS